MQSEQLFQSESINELAAALCAAQAMMVPIRATKKADIPTKGTARIKYAYATIADVIRSLKEPLTLNGLAFVQRFETSANGDPIMVTQLLHTSGQWIASRLTMHVAGSDSRVLGSAITYARRYSLSAITGLAVVGEDDNGAAATVVAGSLEGIDPGEPLADYRAECAYLRAVAIELYGEAQADTVLESLAAKRFRIADGDWRMIPRVKLDYAIEALRKKAESKQ